MRTRCLILSGLITLPSLSAEIRVSPGERVITSALEAASAGDTIVLSSGVYYESVRIGKAVTLRGEAGAVLDGAVPLQSNWSSVVGMEGAFSTEAK